jgi:hypothetical protein
MRYWHTEMRQVIHAATAFYAAGCRTGHRGAQNAAAGDTALQERWAVADPLTGIPPALLRRHQGQAVGTENLLTETAMRHALTAGDATPLSEAVSDIARYGGSWWVSTEHGWVRVTDPGHAGRLDKCAAHMAGPGASARRVPAAEAAASPAAGGPATAASTDVTSEGG